MILEDRVGSVDFAGCDDVSAMVESFAVVEGEITTLTILSLSEPVVAFPKLMSTAFSHFVVDLGPVLSHSGRLC